MHRDVLGRNIWGQPNTPASSAYSASAVRPTRSRCMRTLHGTDRPMCRTPADDAPPRRDGRVGEWCARMGNTTHCRDRAYTESCLGGRAAHHAEWQRVGLHRRPPPHMALPSHPPVAGRCRGRPARRRTRAVTVRRRSAQLECAHPPCRVRPRRRPRKAGGQGGAPALLSAPLHDRVDLHDAQAVDGVVHTGRLVTCDSPEGTSSPVDSRVRGARRQALLGRDARLCYTAFSLSSVYPSAASSRVARASF